MGGMGGDGGEDGVGSSMQGYESVLKSFGPLVRIGRGACRRDVDACRENLTKQLQLELGGGRDQLPSDAL